MNFFSMKYQKRQRFVAHSSFFHPSLFSKDSKGPRRGSAPKPQCSVLCTAKHSRFPFCRSWMLELQEQNVRLYPRRSADERRTRIAPANLPPRLSPAPVASYMCNIVSPTSQRITNAHTIPAPHVRNLNPLDSPVSCTQSAALTRSRHAAALH